MARLRNILITGGDGLIARHFTSLLTSKGYNVLAPSKNQLDITDYWKCRQTISRYSVDLIIHAAAYTSVDKAEKEPDLVNLVNVSGTRNIASICNQLNIPMLFFSTCAVFDGTNHDKPYTIWDKENPTSIYAESKYKAEQEVKALLNKFYILRIVHVYGKGRSDFVTQTIDKLKNTENPDISIIDQILNVNYAKDICNAALDLIESGRYGVYHYNSLGQTSRKGIVEFIASVLNTPNYSISRYEGKLANRPYYTIMDNSEIETVLKNPIPSWQDSLRGFINGI